MDAFDRSFQPAPAVSPKTLPQPPVQRAAAPVVPTQPVAAAPPVQPAPEASTNVAAATAAALAALAARTPAMQYPGMGMAGFMPPPYAGVPMQMPFQMPMQMAPPMQMPMQMVPPMHYGGGYRGGWVIA